MIIKNYVHYIVGRGVESKRIDKEEIEIYIYGYSLLIEVSICITFSLAIAFIFGAIAELMLYWLIFIPLRCMGGGYHAKETWKCLILSFASIFLVCALSDDSILIGNLHPLVVLNCIMIFFFQKRVKVIQYTRNISSKKIVNGIWIIATLFSYYNLSKENYSLAMSIILAQLTWCIAIVVETKTNK